jgi:hypothetical protein
MKSMRLPLVFLSVLLAGCIDGTGPRARPDGIDDVDEPGNGGGNGPSISWWETQPRVIAANATDSITLNVTVTGPAQEVTVQLRTGTNTTMQRLSATQFTARLPAAWVLFGYRSADLHQAAGVITVEGAGGTDEAVLLVNVKDGTVPVLNATRSINPTMQASDHVVNIRYDAVNPGGPISNAVFRSFYDVYPDDYDFIAIVEQVQSSRKPVYIAVRNAIDGIGQPRLDNGGQYGSGARLEGIIQFPVDADLDLARTDNIHEIAHRWMNYLTQPLLATRRPHWPLSDLAVGIMGWSPPATDEAFSFPWDLQRQADGTYLVLARDTPRSFNDLELYLMGLLPPDSVGGHVVFADQAQTSQLRVGGVLRGRVDTVRVSDVIAREGPRQPAAAVARREFRIATIVLSRVNLLSRDELAFFEHVAARGEQRVGLQYSDGLLRGTTLPFFLATGGRATLMTSLRPPVGPQ